METELLGTQRKADGRAEREMRGECSLFVCVSISLKPLKTLVLSSQFNQTRHRVMTTKVNCALSLKIYEKQSRLPVT